MLRKSFRFQSELAAFLDAVLVCATLLAALVTHKVLAWLFPDTFATFDMFWSNSWLYVLVVPVWGFVLDFSGVYRQFLGLEPGRALRQIARAGLLSFAILLGLLYVLKLHMVPRTILGIHCVYAIAAVSLRGLSGMELLPGQGIHGGHRQHVLRRHRDGAGLCDAAP